MLEHVQTQQEEADAMYYKERDQGEISEDTRKAMGCYRIITTTRGICNELFYDQIIRLGNIHNGFIRLNTNNQVVGFKFHDSITIDENEQYDAIATAMDTLNVNIAKEQDTYKYTGQSLCSLAYAYYTNSYDLQIISNCSPQVYDILTSKASMTSPFLGFYKDMGEVANDINKQYTNILMDCDNYCWPIYMPTDEVRLYDGVIGTGIYYIESTGGFALQGNGWYCGSVLDKALNYKLITTEDINYQLNNTHVFKTKPLQTICFRSL